MRTHLTNWLLAGTVAAAVLASGCTSAQKGAAAGGAIGATSGAIWANNAGKLDSWEGAGVGLATGGLIGALVGDGWDYYQNKQEAETRGTTINALQGDLAGKEKSLADMQAEIDRLKNELGQKPVQVESKDGTIRFTILNEVLYDAGKSDLRPEGLTALDSVLDLIQKEYPGRAIIIEGHTDSDPIKASAWKSNWELSAARSLTVVHYFADKKGVAPEQLSAAAFGEFKPAAPNDSAANKKLNRRAVIVVMPDAKNILIDRQS